MKDTEPASRLAMDFAGVQMYIKVHIKQISCPKPGVLDSADQGRFMTSVSTKVLILTDTWMTENISRSAVDGYLRIDRKTVGSCITIALWLIEPYPSERLDNLVNMDTDLKGYCNGRRPIRPIDMYQPHSKGSKIL